MSDDTRTAAPSPEDALREPGGQEQAGAARQPPPAWELNALTRVRSRPHTGIALLR
ncbi:hypothetical protein [Streptomyces sp. NPDC053560]|uniref:hypothetical protein n=1 Tax=Streptomyces sp. NPDC053560 TaxID=3365711 RepID=UPI0037D28947